MADTAQKIRARLKTIWEPPDFSPLLSLVHHTKILVKKGDILFSEDDRLDNLYIIQEGFVELYRLSEEGKETTTYLFGKGYALGVRALTSSDHRAKHTAEALTDAKIIAVSHETYFHAVSSNPEYLIDLTAIFIDRLNYTEQKLEGFIRTDVNARIANFFLDFIKRFCSTTNNDPITLPLELTHQRIAQLVGSFRETVTVALHKLEKEGVVKTDRGTIRITNLQKLQEFAKGKKKV